MSETTHDSGQPVPEAPVQRFIHDYWGNMNPNSLGQYVLYEDYEKLKRERDGLQQWKESQLSVTPDWQEIGREMGLPIGVSVSEELPFWIKRYKAMLADAEREIKYHVSVITRLENALDNPRT